MFVMFDFVFFSHFMFTCSSVADFNKQKIKNIKYLIEKNLKKINNCV